MDPTSVAVEGNESSCARGSRQSFRRYAIRAGRSSGVNGRSTFTPSVEITPGRGAGGGGAVAAMNLNSSS
jgi:hypothetical protein